jgi:ABC-type sugar transport system ATPase subunit
MDQLLTVRGIDKRFGGVHALRSVDAEFAVGEVHALMGENGAGKSTLGKIIAGVLQPDVGSIVFDGSPVTLSSPLAAQRLGISIIFQELDLFPSLTVAENLVIGNLQIERGPLVNTRELNAFCRPLLEKVELNVGLTDVLGDLPIGHVQLVAIARALSMNARLIVMDEPTSSLTDDAVDTLFRLVRRLRDRGVTIIYVSHKMDEIFRIADRITVLRDGVQVGTRPVADTRPDELIRLMVGRRVTELRRARRATGADDPPLLRVRELTTAKLKRVSFDLNPGEVLGVAGLVGAGRTELGQALFGLDPVVSGSVEFGGRPIRPRSVREAMRIGIGYLPEDRKEQGLMMSMSVLENSSMSVLPRLRRFGFVQLRREQEAAREIHARTRLKAASSAVPVQTLSGGNQQKVLLARWLWVDPQVLFLDDPTRGVDVGAKQDVYEIIAELSQAGKGVVFVSSELPELLRCCDRIMVLHNGENMGVLRAADATQEAIMALATRTEPAAGPAPVPADGVPGTP